MAVFSAKLNQQKRSKIEKCWMLIQQNKSSHIDNSIITKPPDKRLLKKISYAHEKTEIEQNHNGTEYEIPQKYLRTKNIRNSIRRKIEEN